MDRRNLFKIQRIPSLAESLAKRNQNLKIERQEKQREYFWSKREQQSSLTAKTNKRDEIKQNLRLEMLKKWKAEKIKNLEEAKKNKKPVFKVGILQRTATGSPLLQKSNFHGKLLANKENHTNQGDKSHRMVTRSLARKIESSNAQQKPAAVNGKKNTAVHKKIELNNKFCIMKGGAKEQINSHAFTVPKCVTNLPNPNKLTLPYSPEMFKRKIKGACQKPDFTVSEAQNQVEDKQESEPEINKVITPKKIDLIDKTPLQSINYSSFKATGSGKKNRSHDKINLHVDEGTKNNEEFKIKISSFRKYIECETKRLLEACDKWKHIYEEFQEISEDVEGDIDSLIGKTNLLTSDKFKQFEDLIDKCEKGDTMIKIEDLQGFQDWVSIEVHRMDTEFKKLEMRKCNNWVSEPTERKKIEEKKVKANGNPSKRPVGKSNIRAHILAARKLLKEGQSEKIENNLHSSATKENITPKNNEFLLKHKFDSETKENHPRLRSSKKLTPNLNKRNSGLGILVASQKNKFLTSAEYSPGLENLTPRSILRKTPRAVNHRVTFDQLAENKMSLIKNFDGKFIAPLNQDNTDSPRVVLKSLENLTPGIVTRARAKSVAPRDSPFIDYCL